MKPPSVLSVIAVLVGSSAVFARSSWSPGESTRAPDPLLVGLESEVEAAPAGAGWTKRFRPVAVRVELLEDAAGRSGARLGFEPFPGESWVLEGIAARPAWGGGVVYSMDVADAAGAERGSASVSVMDTAVSAWARVDQRLLRIELVEAGTHRIVELDEGAIPSCATDGRRQRVPRVPLAPPRADAVSRAAAGASATLDLLVVYTAQAVAAHGGVNPLFASINLAVDDTNVAYLNSDVDLVLRLVHVVDARGYVETGDFNTELNRLQLMYDGHLDWVHPLRDQVGGDVVSLVVASTQWCGMAYIGGYPNNHFFSGWSLSVVSHVCLGGNPTLAHEIGHNMGSDHDQANAAGTPYFPYAYGWNTANGQWRTVMSIKPVAQLLYFSNPSKSHAGQALGLQGQAENWMSLNLNAYGASQWRCATPAPYGTSKPTSSLKLPRMRWSGQPVFDGSGNFELRIEDGEPGAKAICFYGFAPDNAPFAGGTRWVAPPILRLPPQDLDANGDATFPFPQLTQFAPGDLLYVQGWFRDPAHPDGTGAGLTDGLRVDVCEYDD